MQMSQHIVTDDGSNGIVKPNQLHVSPYKDVERLKSCYVLNTIHIATNKGVVSNTIFCIINQDKNIGNEVYCIDYGLP